MLLSAAEIDDVITEISAELVRRCHRAAPIRCWQIRLA